ncbi:hypothetical protein [Sedimentisphaera salicampi]|uniref:hypothetical protein n=1 Tax=Sedimentisphaera salicampi TaxID=1941349 RepID=UPI000B9B2C88|nr:hypothetical protein [Sedimentisphaera salicampi]OXU15720.1 hypothetical protein SMSP1_00507 [Sedimentisphaera salicampi]
MNARKIINNAVMLINQVLAEAASEKEWASPEEREWYPSKLSDDGIITEIIDKWSDMGLPFDSLPAGVQEYAEENYLTG